MTLPTIHRLFATDVRSLALLRISLASISLLDLLLRARDLSVFYTDAGAFPRQAAIGYNGAKLVVSLHMISGEAAVQVALFLVAAAALVCMLLGYRTRTAVAIAWILLVSLHVRTPPLLQAGDTLLRLLFFWSLFLPLGARFSVDAALNSTARRPGNSHLSVGSAAIMLQVAFMYFFGALHKSGVEWHEEQSAVHYALQLDYLVTGIGIWLRSSAETLAVLTRIIWYLELLGPVMLFIPVLVPPIRSLVVVSFAGMHVAFFLAFDIGLFPLVNVIALIPFIPARFWEWLSSVNGARGARTRAGRIGDSVAALCSRDLRLPPTGSGRPTRLASALALIALLLVTLLNLASLPGLGLSLPGSVRRIGDLLHIQQTWDMFAPSPSKENGWMIMPGFLINGAEVDVYRRQAVSPSMEKPQPGDYFPSNRWRKFLMTLARQSQEEYRVYYGRHLCREWNQSVVDDDQKLDKLAIFFAKEESMLDPSRETVEYVSLWEHDCFAPTATLHRP